MGPWEWEPTPKIIHPAMSDHLTKFSGSSYNHGWRVEIVGMKNMGLCGMGNLGMVISLVSPVTVLKLVQHHTWSLYCILSVFNQKCFPFVRPGQRMLKISPFHYGLDTNLLSECHPTNKTQRHTLFIRWSILDMTSSSTADISAVTILILWQLIFHKYLKFSILICMLRLKKLRACRWMV